MVVAGTFAAPLPPPPTTVTLILVVIEGVVNVPGDVKTCMLVKPPPRTPPVADTVPAALKLPLASNVANVVESF